jgi:cytochrome c
VTVMRLDRNLILLLGCCAALVSILGGSEPDSASRGREEFEKRCTGCHALDGARVGPPLRGVFGRRAAAEPGFPYSDALRKSQFIWDEARLNRWLADPDGMIPGNDMSFRLDSAAERSAIIAYLKLHP